jgi:hypothetical protein
MIKMIEERVRELLDDMQEFPEMGKRIPHLWLTTLHFNVAILKKIRPDSPLIKPGGMVLKEHLIRLPPASFS